MQHVWIALQILFLLFLPTVSTARQVTVTFWVSGGAEGILDGGRIAPGWLGMLSQLGTRPETEPWIEVGGTRHLDSLQQIDSFRQPEAIIPGEALLRVKGQLFFSDTPAPWVVSNAAVLPQFPEVPLPVESEWTWRHPDGGELRVLGAWSDQVPLRVPADLLRPLQVLPARESIRNHYLDASNSLEVFVMPEGETPSEWSKAFPDADVIVEPPGGAAQVVEVANGERIRVRPGMHGRSVIRVWVRWDTVTKTFGAPKAEVVWVSPCVYALFDLPSELADEIRTLETVSLDADVIWDPNLKKPQTPTVRPDGLRAQQVPEDEAWFMAKVPAAQWSVWRNVEDPQWPTPLGSVPRSPTVALPASVVAGRGNWNCPMRRDLLSGAVVGEWLEVTTRSLIATLEETTP